MIDKKRILILCILILFAAIPMMIQWTVQNEFKKYLSRVEMVFESDDSNYWELWNHREYLNKRYLTSFSHELQGVYEENELAIIGKDKNYDKFYPYFIIEGRDCIEGEAEILISEDFGKKLYSKGKVVGQTIEILGNSYVITGVYGKDALENIYDSNMEVVYTSSKAITEKDNNISYRVLFSEKDGECGLFFNERLKEYILQGIPYINLNPANIYDYTDYSMIISQFFKSSVFIIEFLGFVFITIIIFRKLKDYRKQYRIQLNDYYTKEIIYKNMDTILIEAIKIVLLVFLWIIILRLVINFKFDIPGRVLPPDDIFDFKFYAGLFAKQESYYKGGIYLQLYRRLLKIEFISFLSSCVFSVLIFIAALQLKGTKIYGKFDKAVKGEV